MMGVFGQWWLTSGYHCKTNRVMKQQGEKKDQLSSRRTSVPPQKAKPIKSLTKSFLEPKHEMKKQFQSFSRRINYFSVSFPWIAANFNTAWNPNFWHRKWTDFTLSRRHTWQKFEIHSCVISKRSQEFGQTEHFDSHHKFQTLLVLFLILEQYNSSKNHYSLHCVTYCGPESLLLGHWHQ